MEWHGADKQPLALVALGYQNIAISADVRIDQANATDPARSFVSLCGRMTQIYGGPTGYCFELRAGPAHEALPPAQAASRPRATWRLIAHKGNRAGQNRSAGAPPPTPLVLGSGQLAVSFNVESWHSLTLRLDGVALAASIDNRTVVHVPNDGSFDHGLAGLGSGWNVAWFNKVQI